MPFTWMFSDGGNVTMMPDASLAQITDIRHANIYVYRELLIDNAVTQLRTPGQPPVRYLPVDVYDLGLQEGSAHL